jgi:hypothetical protein
VKHKTFQKIWHIMSFQNDSKFKLPPKKKLMTKLDKARIVMNGITIIFKKVRFLLKTKNKKGRNLEVLKRL